MPIDEAHKKRAREELPKSVVKTPIKIVGIKEWSRLRLIEQQEEAKRIKLIEKEKAEIPWWVEDEGDSVEPDLTFEEQQTCIEELKDALDLCWAERGSARKDQQFMSGYYDCCLSCPFADGNANSGIRDDFDTTVSRLPFNIRYNILGTFASMIILKDCLKLFLSNPFWYLDVDDAFPNSEGAEAPFGAQLHTLYKTFLKAEPQLAHHWRAQTTRLANVRYSGYFSKRDPTFGRANKEILRAKAYQFAAARLEDKAFRCLLKDEDEDDLRTSLGELYVTMAEFAKDLATSQPLLEWRLLDEIPTEFTRQSKVMQTAHIHQLGERESRLNGHQVIAIQRPYFFRTGGWNREGRTPEVRVSSAHVLVEDRIGQYHNEAYSSDEDAFPTRRKKRKPKKAKTENKVAAAKKKGCSQRQSKEGS
ncbi:Carboxylesterase type B [Penicillium freii]|nr:Carboxylesterase type B [Penicillium freii]